MISCLLDAWRSPIQHLQVSALYQSATTFLETASGAVFSAQCKVLFHTKCRFSPQGFSHGVMSPLIRVYPIRASSQWLPKEAAFGRDANYPFYECVIFTFQGSGHIVGPPNSPIRAYPFRASLQGLSRVSIFAAKQTTFFVAMMSH